MLLNEENEVRQVQDNEESTKSQIHWRQPSHCGGTRYIQKYALSPSKLPKESVMLPLIKEIRAGGYMYTILQHLNFCFNCIHDSLSFYVSNLVFIFKVFVWISSFPALINLMY